MRPFLRVALPIGSLVMLAAAAVLVALNLRDFSPASGRAARLSGGDQSKTVLQSGQAGQPSTALAAQSPTAKAVKDPPPPAPAAVTKPAAAPAVAVKTTASTSKTTGRAVDPSSGSDKGAPVGIRPAATVITARGVNTAPEPGHPYFLERVGASGGLEYGTTRNNGLFVSTDGGKSWSERSDGLPVRVIYPFTNDPITTPTSIGVDPRDGRRVAVTTATALYLSTDAGLHWRAIRLDKAIRHSTYLTAVALSPFDNSTMAVATSFSGFFVTTDGGKKWHDRSKSLDFLYQGAGFYEEISGLAYSPKQPGVIYMAVGFGGDVYRSTGDGKSWISTAFPGKKHAVICGLNPRLHPSATDQNAWTLRLATQRSYWSFDPATGAWKTIGSVPPPPPPSKAKAARIASASNRAGIYVSPWQAHGSKLQHWIAFLKKNGLDTLVVDVKDDRGDITYNSRVPFAWKIGAVHPYFNIEDLIRVAHANGIYVIGRLVIFKDKYLYRYDHNHYAIWDPRRHAPWGFYEKQVDSKTGKATWVQKEFWVDPFSEAVWRYNLSIAEELQKLGINEIQFDYIRFPSEVNSKNAVYRFRRKGMTEEDALESFLRMARGALKIPISVDIFGYNGWYPNAGWVGQDIEVYSNYADVISPMYYPSLFPRDFISQLPYLERAKFLYRVGTWRAQRIVDGRALVRPFVQAFLLGSYELKMDKTHYSQYLREELIGAQEAHSSGFLLWNFGTDYYMVTFPLGPYVPSRSPAKLQPRVTEGSRSGG